MARGLLMYRQTTLKEFRMIAFTPVAAKAVRRFIKSSETPVAGLRLFVSGGGCSGLQYGLRLEAAQDDDDIVVDGEGFAIFVDAMSQPLLDGVTVDFVDSMVETGFRFSNPNATAACGCGKSFSL